MRFGADPFISFHSHRAVTFGSFPVWLLEKGCKGSVFVSLSLCRVVAALGVRRLVFRCRIAIVVVVVAPTTINRNPAM